MGNRDINLFKAAGGERARGNKRSPLTYMLLVTIVVIVAAVGVLVYFNMKANSAEKDYEAKERIKANYSSTIETNKLTSAEYKKVRDDIVAAAAINAYVDGASALYPPASADELLQVKEVITTMQSISYSINEPEEDEAFVPWDYNGLREMLYADDAPYTNDRELFYYGLQKLAEEQEEEPEVNHWFTYFRGYMLVVFASSESTDGSTLDNLCDTMITGGATMDGNEPFSRFKMENASFTSGYYSPAKHCSLEYDISEIETLYFNVLLLPMKSVIERAYDILEAHSNALVQDENNNWQGQRELASYGLDNIVFTNESLSFDLILPKEDIVKGVGSLNGYMTEFENSIYFIVAENVERSKGESVSAGVSYPITLGYKYIAVAEEE